MSIQNLIQREGWKIRRVARKDDKTGLMIVEDKIVTQYENKIGLLDIKHPVLLHLEIYAKHTDPAVKYQHMKIGHDILWPREVFHHWTQRRFMTHCEGWNYITLAAGANMSKSHDLGKIGILFWYGNPRERNCTIASVTLASLMTRVWGYITNHIRTMNVDLAYKYYRSNPPKILLEEPSIGKNKIDDDTLHGMFAVTAQKGDDYQAIATWIGKHPKNMLLVILDEMTDMPLSLLEAIPNLNAKPEKFQLMGAANSDSTQDLHGLLSKPKHGWNSVSTDMISWETTQKNGICLYFNPYESPAIIEEDPVKRKIFEGFLIGRDTLKEKELELGTDSDKFYRWVMGFWKSRGTEEVTVSEAFLKDFNPRTRIEWSGYYPIQRVAGLDPAFSVGGDKCILRIANVGHAFSNKMMIDFNQGEMMFEIKLKAIMDKSMEIQIADQVIDKLIEYGVPLEYLAIDVTGQGRAIGAVIILRNQMRGYPLGFGVPLKIYALGQHNSQKKKKGSAPDVLTLSTHQIWNTTREYIEQGQIGGLDETTIEQLTNRMVQTLPNGTKKLESKREYRVRSAATGQGRSPDEADASSLCVQVVQQRLLIAPGATKLPPPPSSTAQFEQKMSAFQALPQHSGKPPTPEMPSADFSGGLDSYVTFTKPF